MYLVLSYAIDENAADPVSIEMSLRDLVEGRSLCELLPGLLITPLNSQRDFLAIYKRVEELGEANAGVLKCVAFAAETGSRMRCNVEHDRDLARDICSHVPRP